MKKEVILIMVCTFLLLGCTSQELPSEPSMSDRQNMIEEQIVNATSIEAPAENNQPENTTPQIIPQTTEQKNKTPEIKEALPEIIEPQFEPIWQDRINAALAPSYCPPIEKTTYPGSYYQGQLTDTHLHIPDIPDWPADEEPRADELEGRFGGPRAFIGWNVKMSEIACTLKHESTHKNFAFFPVYEEMPEPEQILYIWKKTMEIYPEQFTPFIMSSGDDDEPNGFPTVDAATLREMLAIYPGLFQGYGEIGLYKREGGAAELPPDAQRLLDIYPVLREHNLVVYFHLGDGHKYEFEKVLKANPDITFIWHGDQLSADEVEDILSEHPNAYYGIDAFWGHDQDTFHLFVGKSKEAYLNKMDAEFDTVLNYAVADWKSVIERHPDQVLWGIDRGDAVWNYDLDVGQMQVKLARAFIGKLKPDVQEKFAYKNAQRLLPER